MNSSSTAERVIGGGKGIRGDRADCAQCLTTLMLQRLLGLTDLYRVAAMSIGRINQCHWVHGEGGKERDSVASQLAYPRKPFLFLFLSLSLVLAHFRPL